MKFNSLGQIPDPIGPERYLSTDKPELWAPRLVVPAETEGITPHELAHIYLGDISEKPASSTLLKQTLLDSTPGEAIRSVEKLELNHCVRALARVVLHPNRDELFDLPKVYDAEVARHAWYPVPSERTLYEHFIETWGVLDRTIKSPVA